jgi:hypothetical protein
MATAKKEEKKPIKTGASSRHITNLKQFILETFDIYAPKAWAMHEHLFNNAEAGLLNI